jgi:hypothetical protein
MESEAKKQPENQRGMIISGLIVMGIGVLFLADEMGWIPGLSRTWPVILIVVGFALLAGALFKKPKPGGGQ